MKFKNKNINMDLNSDVLDLKIAKLSPYYITPKISVQISGMYKELRKVMHELKSNSRTVLVHVPDDNSIQVFHYKIENLGNGKLKVEGINSDAKYKKQHFCAYAEVTCDHITTGWNMKLIGDVIDDNSKVLKQYNFNSTSQQEHVLFMKIITNCICIECFLQFVEVQTTTLKPKHEIRDGVICKYKSLLNFPVTIVDSTWFTNLIVAGAFKVRGHFRLQPYGHLLASKKLIWIKEFEKHGYTRKAKKLNE